MKVRFDGTPEDQPVSFLDVLIMAPATLTGPQTNAVLLACPAGRSLRIRKFTVHCSPAVADGVYPVLTLSLGGVPIYSDIFQAGLPYTETIPIPGTIDGNLTVTFDTGVFTFNARYEVV